MELLYCPVCSKAVSSQADITACPECCHPFNVQEWKEESAKKSAKENEAVIELLRPKDKEGRLKTITKAELINAYNEQKNSNSGWTFYNENDIVQRTLENRFNFLLVAYTIFLTAYFSSKNDIDKLIILFIGLVIVSFLFLAIIRTKNRFQITLDIVHSLEQNDVSPIILRENEFRHDNWFNRKFRNNSITGLFIPLIMFLSFLIGIIYNIFIKGVLK
jgi:hypothetical protein